MTVWLAAAHIRLVLNIYMHLMMAHLVCLELMATEHQWENPHRPVSTREELGVLLLLLKMLAALRHQLPSPFFQRNLLIQGIHGQGVLLLALAPQVEFL